MTERRGVVLTVLVGLALVVISMAAALSGGQVHRLAGGGRPPPPPPSAAPRTAAPPPEPQVTVPPAAAGSGRSFDWVLQVLLALAVVVVIATLAFVVLRIARQARSQREPADSGGDLAIGISAAEHASRAVRSGLDDLDAPGSDPRGVVIGCWLALERATAAVGLARRDTDSPTDLVTRLLAGADVPAPVLDDLADLYRAARYAPDEVTDSMRDAARQALTEVARALERPLPGHDGADSGREPAEAAP